MLQQGFGVFCISNMDITNEGEGVKAYLERGVLHFESQLMELLF